MGTETNKLIKNKERLICHVFLKFNCIFVNKTFAASSPDHQIIKYENIKNTWFGINKYNIHEAEENISTEKILILENNFTMGKNNI